MTVENKLTDDNLIINGWEYEIYYGFITQEQADKLNALEDESEADDLAQELCDHYLIHGFDASKIEALDGNGNSAMINVDGPLRIPTINCISKNIPRETGMLTLIYICECKGNWYTGKNFGITITKTDLVIDDSDYEIFTIKNSDGSDVDYEINSDSTTYFIAF